MLIFLAIIAGSALLGFGGELLVRGATKVAEGLGISRLVIGLTVVAFGTSSPELAVSVKAALTGQSDIALGNVVGSNIFNVLFILGISAAIVPLMVSSQILKREVPIMIGLSMLLVLLALDDVIGRADGLVLVSVLAWYCYTSVKAGRMSAATDESPVSLPGPTSHSLVALVVGGLLLLVIGAQVFVWGAVGIARAFGLSELVIGLTIVAAGTSLPEVAASLAAAWKGEREIAIGNVVGSNIFNIAGVLGITALLHPVSVAPSALSLDIPVMLAVALACLPVFFTGGVISRWEGFGFLFYYAAYTSYLILRQSGDMPAVSEVLLLWITPLTAVTMLVVSFRKHTVPPDS